MAKKRRKKASKKTGTSAKAKIGQVIKTLHSIKKHC
jgi:hypothetical protein